MEGRRGRKNERKRRENGRKKMANEWKRECGRLNSKRKNMRR